MTLLADWLRLLLYLLAAAAIAFRAASHPPGHRNFVYYMSVYVLGLGILLLARNDYLPFTRDEWANYIMTPALVLLTAWAWAGMLARRRRG